MAEPLKQVNNVAFTSGSHPRKGLAYALLSIPVGMILWVIIWQMGFIASISSFAIAWLAIYLYRVGARSSVTRKVLPYLIAIIVVGVVLSFIAGMASDAVDFYNNKNSLSGMGTIFSGDFWSFFFDNLFNNPDLWASYTSDIIMSVVFAAIGLYGIVRDLFMVKKPAAVKS